MIYVVDFGSQTAHLIARRIRERGIEVEITLPEDALMMVKSNRPKGVILSGGPADVFEVGAPTIEKQIFSLQVPILGICYGWQLTAHLLGGKVISSHKEYGPAKLKIQNSKFKIMAGIPEESKVWVSHGNTVVKIPKGFEFLGETDNVKAAAVGNLEKKIFGVQFHPEVEHTEFGRTILENFISICGEKISQQVIDINLLKEQIKEIVGDNFVIGAISGGVDSTVAGVLTAAAIGKKFIPVYVENGLMRPNTFERIQKILVPIMSSPW